MGTQVATILGQTPDDSLSSDLTHPSLTEDVQFGIFVSNGDEGGGFDGVLSSIGIWARDSNQLCQASFGQDNAPTDTVITGHVDRNDCVAFRSTTIDGTAERVRAFVTEPIPNGVRIGAVVPPGSPRNIPIGAMLFAGDGVRAKVHQVTISRVVGAITEIDPAIDGLSVDMIVALTSTDQFDGANHGGFAHQTVSFHAFEDGTKRSSVSQSIAWRSANNNGSVAAGGLANGLVVADGNHVQSDPNRHPELATAWEFAIDIVNGMIRIETIREANENTDPEIGLLVAHLAGDRAIAGLMTTPAAPSTDAVNVDFSPAIDSNLSGLLLQLNNVSAAGVDLIGDPMAGHYGMAMISAAPDSDQFTFQTSWESGADPTHALTTQGDFLRVRSDDGSLAIAGDAEINGLGSIELVDIGSAPDAEDGDNIRVSFDKINNSLKYLADEISEATAADNLSIVFTESQIFQFPFLAITDSVATPNDDVSTNNKAFAILQNDFTFDSTTQTDIPDLSFDVVAGEVWAFQVNFFALSLNADADLRFNVVAPTDSDGRYAVSNAENAVTRSYAIGDPTLAIVVSNGDDDIIKLDGIIEASENGTVSFQSRNSAGTEEQSWREFSWLEARRIT